MIEYTATYLLDENQEKELEKVTRLYNNILGTAHTQAEVFDAIMQLQDIDKIMAFCKHNFMANQPQGAL